MHPALHTRSVLLIALILSILAAGLAPRAAEPFIRAIAVGLSKILEGRFERPDIDDWSRISGLVVPAGHPSRLHEAFRLASKYPHLRIFISGPSDYELGILANAESDVRARTFYERDSLREFGNTYGNAYFSARYLGALAHERWLLVTSAAHMPRAFSTYRKAGFDLAAWPVADRSDHLETLIRVTRHEWFGLAAYWWRGYSDALLPASTQRARV